MQQGRGVTLVDGVDAVLFAYGPVLLNEAVKAAALMRERHGVSVSVVNLPWLNRIDPEWLLATIKNTPSVFTLDNHYIIGGQGDMILRTLAERATDRIRIARRIGVSDIPACGTNDEVLRAHGLDAEGLCATMAASLVQKATA